MTFRKQEPKGYFIFHDITKTFGNDYFEKIKEIYVLKEELKEITRERNYLRKKLAETKQENSDEHEPEA